MCGCWYDFCKIQWQIVIASSPFLFPPLAFASLFTCYLRVTFHNYIPKWTAYLQAIWSFTPSLSPMASLPSGPPWPLSAQRPYPPVSHAIIQPSISTLQPLMPSTTPASLTSSPSCLSSAIHPSCLVPHDLSQPSIPPLQSHMLSFGPASLPSSPSCPPHNPSIPNLQSFIPFFSHTSLLSGHSCPPSAQHSTLHSLSSAPLPSGPYCPSSALHVRFKTPINKK